MTGDELLKLVYALSTSARRQRERLHSARTTCDAVIEALEVNGYEIVQRQPTLDEAV